MKLLELDLRAYGPFTDRRLDLGAGQQGLHLVYGPNEAGKSSALRALRGLLFGIPERTRDDFKHDKRDLRIGGRLRNARGDELRFVRRKGRRNTLLDLDCRELPEDALGAFLGDVDEPRFARRHGIDYESLVAGGQELLVERGRAAEALFGSALGAVRIRALLDGLDREANALFLRQGSKPRINVLVKAFAESELRLRETSLMAREWEQARASLDDLLAELATREQEIDALMRARSRLERIRRTLPELVRRDDLIARLAVIGEVPVLGDDVASRRESATTDSTMAREREEQARARAARLREQIEDLSSRLSDGLLQGAEQIETLREQLGSHRKAARDRGPLLTELAKLEAEAIAAIRRMRPEIPPEGALDAILGLAPLLRQRRRATELGAQQAALINAVERGRRELDKTRVRLHAKREALAAMPQTVATEPLAQALDAARRAGELDQILTEAALEHAQSRQNCARALAALGLWSGSLDELLAAPLPDDESLRRAQERWRDLDQRQQQLTERRPRIIDEIRDCETALRARDLAGVLPTEADLSRARAHRDQGWRLVKSVWLDGCDPVDAARELAVSAPLHEAVETAITNADAIADRLRREAGVVHQRASDLARLEGLRQELDALERDRAELDDETTRVHADWLALWSGCGLTPTTPNEMLPWLARASRLREQIRQSETLRVQIEVREATRSAHGEALDRALATLGPLPDGLAAHPTPTDARLSERIATAESVLRQLDEGARRRRTATDEIAELSERVDELARVLDDDERALACWREDWANLVSTLGLAETASPGEVADDLQAIADALKAAEAARAVRARIEGIDRDAAAFQAEATTVCRRLAPDLLDHPIEERVGMLHAQLVEQRRLATERDALSTQARDAEEEARAAVTTIQSAERRLAELCRQACCDTSEQLPAIEARVREHAEYRRRLFEIEAGLVRTGDGRTLEALREEARGCDQDQVAAELDALDRRLEQELRPRQRELIARKAEAEHRLAAMGGSDQAAAIAEASQQILASLRAHAERYVRLKLAGRILRDEMERFRRQQSDPILRRASLYFSKLTCESFQGIETDFDESDQPILVGRRGDGERLRVDAMSTGTRDQLYLALRLATLEPDLDGAEPMPFIVDDILVQFDDERALATLEALAELSTKTQVILFTHHRRDLEQAHRIDTDQSRIHVHRLP